MKRLVAWVMLLSVLYSTLSLVRHAHFQSGGFDLGLYDQAVWQYSRFLSPYNTIKERFILGDHLTLTLPLLAPLFWLWNDVRALLIFQATWISTSAIAIYLLARHRKFSPTISLIVSILYSLFYGIQYAVFFDFHPIVFGIGLMAWMLYFFEAKRIKLFWLTLILVLATQENMGLAVAAIGFVYIFHKQWRTSGIGFIIGGVVVSLVAAKAIALFSPIGFQYQPQISPNPIKTITDFFNAQEKRDVWLYTLSWFSFLPILSPGAILGIFFDVAQYFVTGPEFARMWSPFMHHRISLAPLVTLGTLDALAFLKSKKVSVLLVAYLLVLSALFQQYAFHLPLNKLTKREYWQEEQWMRDNRQLLAKVPQGTSIATQQSLIPHLSHRQNIYLMWPRPHDFDDQPCGQTSCWWLDFSDQSQYLIIDLHPNQWITQLLETNGHVAEALKNMEKEQKITLVDQVGEARLYSVH